MTSSHTHGRGAPANPPNRFERLHYEADTTEGLTATELEAALELTPAPATQFFS